MLSDMSNICRSIKVHNNEKYLATHTHFSLRWASKLNSHSQELFGLVDSSTGDSGWEPHVLRMQVDIHISGVLLQKIIQHPSKTKPW